jgi:sterol desaturase/sphingolipid hydroxylase (fatty acid hydroxylase superfamily)
MWSTTFERFPPGKTPLFGAITVGVEDWTRPRSGESRIFEQDLLERLGDTKPWVPPALYVPLSAVLFWLGVDEHARAVALLLWYGAGVLAWTLVEYLSHRFSFHHAPTTRRQLVIGYLIHGVHHAYPDDRRRLTTPVVMTLLMGAMILAVFLAALGRPGFPCFAGFIHGYLLYDLVHYAIHRGSLGTPIGRFLRRYHLQHHFATPHRQFGVTSPLWDIIFRTSR